MKKYFSFIGLITIILTSFILSKKTTLAVKEIDEIMIQIKENQEKYKQEPQDAKIKNNTIIPGINGKTVDIEESYKKMKTIGKYNEKYLVYKEQTPQITIEKQYDKYIISGNETKPTISIIFIISDKEIPKKILETLEKNNIQASFFIDTKWIKNNKQTTKELLKKGYTIGTIGNNITKKEFKWINDTTKRIGKQKNNYCLAQEENEENLNECKQQKNYTIKPIIINSNEPLTEIKKTIKNGSLIALPINDKTTTELDLIINYINSKAYTIKELQEQLSEKNN